MEYMQPSSVRIVAERGSLAVFAVLVVTGLACLASAHNATAVAGLVAIVLALGWMVGATAVTHLCGGQALVLRPPQSHADFHQLSDFRVEIQLGNQRRNLPALFLNARLETRAEGVALASPPVALPALAARSRASLAWTIAVRKRGEVELLGVRVRLAFPGSLVAHECRFAFVQRLLALPATYCLDNRALGLLTGHRRVGNRSAAMAASIGDYAGVREYRAGDNPRDIHIGLSIRLPDFPDHLVVREFEDPTNDDIYVVLDTYLPDGAADGDALRYNHEVSLSFTAAFCRLLVDRRYRVRFCAVGRDGAQADISFSKQPTRDLQALEAWLARVKPLDQEGPVKRLLAEIAKRVPEAVFLVTPRDAAAMHRHGVVALPPQMQTRFVREVSGGA